MLEVKENPRKNAVMILPCRDFTSSLPQTEKNLLIWGLLIVLATYISLTVRKQILYYSFHINL